jgi:hypothetical protein
MRNERIKKEYYYHTNDTDSNRYDIFEVGDGIVAKSVSWDLVEKIVEFLNKNQKRKTRKPCETKQ